MINKEKLLAISDLALSGIIDKMNNDQFEEYCKSLDIFIESLPNQETELKKSFEAKDFDSFSTILLTVWDALAKIFANGLAQNCRGLLSSVKTTQHEVFEASLTSFLTATSALSIDIQMAQHSSNDVNPMDMKTPSAEAAGENENRQKLILAVDDVSFLLNGLKSALQSTQYKFAGVTSGAAALKFIEKHKPDLFILDIEMPEMNGYELADRIRKSGQTAPIVFLTGNATKEYVLKAIQVGAADFIVKPINKESVVDKIKKYIGE